MAFQVELRSREQFLGDLVRTMMANTDINDVSSGSDLSTMLEGISSLMYQISLGSLKILENTNLESLVGNALDKKAESLRIPNGVGGIGRIPASQSSGIVTVGSAFQKVSTKFYAGKPAPFSGSKTLYVENGYGFKYNPDGTLVANKRLYVGRGTADRFEGPIEYTTVQNQGSFWVITLSKPLTKNHLYSDLLVLAQGGDRSIGAGVAFQTVAANDVPAISFLTQSTVIIPDGESSVNIPVTCSQFGENGNALAGSINVVPSPPFPGATVTNPTAFKNGRSSESDEDLRNRIKNYPATLSRGTKAAIQAAIQGLSDPTTGRTIVTSVVVEPISSGEFSKVYIDDGSGLEPTYDVQPYELLLQAASGQETTFQTAQFPIAPATAIGAESGPFVLESGESLTVVIDGVSESYSITASNYTNLNAATAYEIVRDFNSQSNIAGWRTHNGGNNIVLTDLSGSAETMVVQAGSLQIKLGFPTSIIRPIFLYENSQIKSFKGLTASLTTNDFSNWNPLAANFVNNLFIVDGVPQTVNVSSSDFIKYQSDLATATITQWAEVLATKIAGCKFTVAGNVIICSSRQDLSPYGTLEIPETRADGSAAGWIGDSNMWKSSSNGGVLYAAGATKDFDFNRFTGEIRFVDKPASGTKIEVGTRQTRAAIQSPISSTGLFALTQLPLTFGNARFVVGFDGEFDIRTVGISTGDKFTPTIPDPVNASNIVRLTNTSKYLMQNVQVGDYLYIIKNLAANPLWGSKVEGLYRVKAVGNNFSPISLTYNSVQASVTTGSAVVTVTIPDHGFSSGARITVTAGSAIGLMTPSNLSQVLAPITVINSNTFSYIAGASLPSNYPSAEVTTIGSLTQIVYDPDCWVEFEISTDQKTDWTPLFTFAQDLDTHSISAFRSSRAIPQIVDFGAGGSLAVDDIVSAINAQIASGTAYKINGASFEISSNDWSNAGTVAILAVIGNASTIWSTGIASSMQSHTAFSSSGYTAGGSPVSTVRNQDTIDRPTSAAIVIDRDLTDIVAIGAEPQIQAPSIVTNYPEGFESIWLTGKQYEFTGRVYNNQTSTPFTGILRTSGAIQPLETSDTAQDLAGDLNRYANYAIRLRDLPIAYEDRLVVEMDLDPINKTVSIPLYKSAQIQDMEAVTGVGKGQVVSFRLKDPDDPYAPDPINFPNVLDGRPFFSNESVYKSFDFRDFKLLTQSVGLYRDVATPSSNAFGFLTAIGASAINGIYDGDTFTINDGTTNVVFEFDDNASVVLGHFPVTFTPGVHATGSFTAIPMLPGTYLDEGDLFTLYDGINAPTVFEYDSDGIYVAGHVPVTYVHGEKASGSVTSWYADPTTGIKDGDTFSIGPTVFEFDTNFSVGVGHVAITISATMSSSLVRSAMITAINGAAIGIAATPGVGDNIDLNASDWGVAWNMVITNLAAPNVGVSIYPVSLTGGVDNATANTIAAAMVLAINGVLTSLAITASDVSAPIVALVNDYAGMQGNQTITTQIASGASITPVNVMSGGTDNSDAAAIQSAIINAINSVLGFHITAQPSIGYGIALSNDMPGTTGNQLVTQSIASGATLSPIGLLGGSDFSDANDRALVLRSTAFGGTSRLRMSIVLPTAPSQSSMVVSHLNDFSNDEVRCNLLVTLGSKSIIAGSLMNTGTYNVSVTDAGNLFLVSIAAPTLNPTGQYQAGNVVNIGGNGPLSGSYTIVYANSGLVCALAPTDFGVSSQQTFNANQYPLSSFSVADKTLSDVADAINAYLPVNPVATAQAIGTYSTNYVKLPSYVTYTGAFAQSGSTLTNALTYNSFDCHYAGSAGIWQYDSSDETQNAIKATSQSVDSIFPTTTEAAGTIYSPIGESVVIVPTNSQTLQRWLNFNATSSLIILADTQSINSGSQIQISSISDGSLGAVKVTGVTGNQLSSFIVGNATESEYSSKVKILSADAKAFMPNQLTLVSNSVASEILRPYRSAPSGSSVTTHNTTTINTFFRGTNSIKYIKTSLNTARLIFYRFGQGYGHSEPLSIGNTIQLTSIGNGIVEVHLGTIAKDLAARVGDMMYIRPTNAAMSYTSPFAADAQCSGLSATTGTSNPLFPEYWGYPVVSVVDAQTARIIAPNITTFNTTTLVTTTDLVFLPAIYNEKNVRTNRQEGAKFSQTVNGGNLYYLIKSLGGNLVSLWVMNSASESTDSMLLDEMSVNTDDYIEIGSGFGSSNQGTFKIVGTNGRNHVVYYNENGGKDEILDSSSFNLGGTGQRIWRVGPINDPNTRPVRIIDSESIKIGDRLRISTPSSGSTWFPSAMYGSWRIRGMGYVGITQAVGTLTPTDADPLLGVRDGDTFTIGDGNKTVTFQLKSGSGVVSDSSYVKVTIADYMSAASVMAAMVQSINSLGSTFSISASVVGGSVQLINRRIDGTLDFVTNNHQNSMNFTITVGGSGAAFMAHTGMAGASLSDGAITPYIDIDFPAAISDVNDPSTGYPADKFQISSNDSAIGFIEQIPFNGYRLVAGHAVNPQNSEESDIFLQPRILTSKMSDTFGTQITGLFKTGFAQTALQGIDGYKVYSGLVREAHRVIDGLPTNPILYPGTKAMGAPVEVLPPLVKTVSISMQVRPKDGVTINSISEIIKSTVASYINGLGVGKPVIISEVIRVVQGLPGVYSVTVTSTEPAIVDDRITVGDEEVVLVQNADKDITVG